MNPPVTPQSRRPPRGLTAIGIFLLLGTVMTLLAGMTLAWRGTALDRMWVLNPRAYKELAPYGKIIGIPFLLPGITFAVAGVDCLNRRIWGWRLAVMIVATQILGDLFSVCFGRVVEGGIGIAIAGALLLYPLTRRC